MPIFLPIWKAHLTRKKRTMSNWADLDQVAIDAIIEYNEYASVKFNTFSPDLREEDYKELCKIVAHLLICNKSLLLYIDEDYRRKHESTDSD